MKRLPLCLLLALTGISNSSEVRWVAVGAEGRRVASADGFTWEHDQRWVPPASGEAPSLHSIAFGEGRFVAVGGDPSTGRIVESADGRHWTDAVGARGPALAISFGGGRFIAADGAGLLVSGEHGVFETGAAFPPEMRLRQIQVASGDTEAGFRHVVIAVQSGATFPEQGLRAATGDGERWIWEQTRGPAWSGIAYGAGRFVSVAPGGVIESCFNGQTWQRQILPGSPDLSYVSWTGARFVAGNAERHWVSDDGMQWAEETLLTGGRLVWESAPGRSFAIRALWLAGAGGLHAMAAGGDLRPVRLPPGPILNAVAFRP
jgi:hypothetical protein